MMKKGGKIDDSGSSIQDFTNPDMKSQVIKPASCLTGKIELTGVEPMVMFSKK
jgi:hypothetical protein